MTRRPDDDDRDPAPEDRTLDFGGGRSDRAPPDDLDPGPAGPGLPSSIAGFRVIRRIGEGGMGVVYEVEQQEPRRSVALKVIRGGPCVDQHALRLFHREAQSLARLKHPGIAAIHEVGRTKEGQPFLVMEMVQGVPLHDYFRLRPLAGPTLREQLHERLMVFLAVCRAVQYAHQRGVIHRDLKPENILVVTEAGAATTSSTTLRAAPPVKILDFGLARIMDAEPGTATAATEVGRILGSLPYMSPEQASGRTGDIDVRTDVYSLGIILYELLTDEAPYRTEGLLIHEAVRAVCEEPPKRPRSIWRRIPEDLETIALKAVEKEPDHRYQTVLAFAEDIERFLGNQPILARPASRGYQFRKLVARHKVAFAFTLTLFFLLTAFGTTMSVMFEVQRQAKEKAILQTRKAARINDFLQEMLSSINPEKARGHEVTVREVLSESAGKLEGSLHDQPEVRASLHATIGRTYLALGRYDEAELHLRRALALRDSLLPADDPEVASSVSDLAALLLKKGDVDAAYPLFQRALAIQRTSLGGQSPEMATNMDDMGVLLKEKGRYAEAESLVHAGLTMRRQTLGDTSAAVASSLDNLATILRAEGKYAEAESVCREALARQRALYGDRHPEVAMSLNNLAAILEDEQKYPEAEPLMRKALETARAVFGDTHPAVASTMNNLAGLLSYEGKNEEAEALYRQALSDFGRQLGMEHPFVASTLNNLGGVLLDEKRYAQAESLFRQAYRIRRKLYGPEHPAVAVALNNLAIVLQREGRLDDAERLFREALAMRVKLLGESHPHVANSLLGLGSLLLQKRNTAEAEPLLRRCLAIRQRTEHGNDWRLAAARNALGYCLELERRYPQAESLMANSVEVLSASPAVPPSIRTEAMEHTAALYQALGRPKRAAELRARESRPRP